MFDLFLTLDWLPQLQRFRILVSQKNGPALAKGLWLS